MPKLHSKQPGFTHSACGPLTKHREGMQKVREIGTLKHVYRNELDKGFFAHGAAYSDSKDVVKRTISCKILNDRAYGIVGRFKYDVYQRVLESIVYKFFDTKARLGVSVNEQLQSWKNIMGILKSLKFSFSPLYNVANL